MRSVKITADDLRPRGCTLMNLQSEARLSASNGSALSLLLPPTLLMTRRLDMQVEELSGKTGCRAAAMDCSVVSTRGRGGEEALEMAGITHTLDPVVVLKTNVAVSEPAPKLCAKQHKSCRSGRARSCIAQR